MSMQCGHCGRSYVGIEYRHPLCELCLNNFDSMPKPSGEIEVGDVVKILARPVGWKEPGAGFNDVQPVGAMCRVTSVVFESYFELERQYIYDPQSLQLVAKAPK